MLVAINIDRKIKLSPNNILRLVHTTRLLLSLDSQVNKSYNLQGRNTSISNRLQSLSWQRMSAFSLNDVQKLIEDNNIKDLTVYLNSPIFNVDAINNSKSLITTVIKNQIEYLKS